MKALLVGLVAVSALLVLRSASAKHFHLGDLRVCNTTRCVAIVNRGVLPHLGSFYYTGPSSTRRLHLESLRGELLEQAEDGPKSASG